MRSDTKGTEFLSIVVSDV